MTIKVGIKIINDRDEEVDILIPTGTIFEVDFKLGMQNVATSKTYTYRIPPESTLLTPVEGVCLNEDLSPPGMVNGRLTPFRYDSELLDQDEVWKRVNAPAGG